MSVYEYVMTHGVDAVQGAVILGVLAAGYVGWRALSTALAWNQDTAEIAMGVGVQALKECEALKTRVKSLEDAVGRAKQRSDEKKQVRIAKVA